MTKPIITHPKVNGLTKKEEARFVELTNKAHQDTNYEDWAEWKRLKRKRWAKDARNDNIVRNHALELFERLKAMVGVAFSIQGEDEWPSTKTLLRLDRARVKAGKLLTKITNQQLH